VGIPASALDLLTKNQILGGIVSSACFAAISGGLCKTLLEEVKPDCRAE
jgi:hypothetical protein